MSRKYGIKVYDNNNPEYPYYIDGMSIYDELNGCTEEEIEKYLFYHRLTDKLSPWVCEIIGWYDSVKSDPARYEELEDVVDEIIFYLETMYGTVGGHPQWIQDFLLDVDGNFGASSDIWIPIVDRVIPHLE